MKDPEIKRIAGIEKYEKLTEEEKILANFKFNDDFHQIQSLLPGGCPGIPKGVYRFKNQEDADKQVNFYIMKTALKR
jgi:hypothetical protein